MTLAETELDEQKETNSQETRTSTEFAFPRVCFWDLIRGANLPQVLQ